MSDPTDLFYNNDYGFVWGPFAVQRMAYLEPYGSKRGRYRIIRIQTDTGNKVQVYISPTGRSIRVFKDGKELK